MTQAVSAELAREKRLRAAAEERAAVLLSIRNEAVLATKGSEAKFEVAMVC